MMAESAEQKASVNEAPGAAPSDMPHRPSPGVSVRPPMWVPPDMGDPVARYRRAAPWIIAVFGLMGAVILVVVPVSAISEIEPSSRRTIVLAAILAFAGVATGIVASSVALAPRSGFTEPLELRRHRIVRHFSARRTVEDAFARQTDAEAAALVTDEMKNRLVRFEKERNAVRLGFLGVVVGALAIGSAAGIMVWEFENPTTVFEIDRIHADTIRIEADARRLAAETQRIEAEVAQIDVATELEQGELEIQAQKLQLELELLQEAIAHTRADTLRIEAQVEAGTTDGSTASQLADIEITIEAILEQIIDLNDEIGRRAFAG